jgi:type VI secretion system protein ImpA
MALDLAKLLTPVSEEAPAGEDLSYDPERTEIEQVFESSVSVDTTGAAAQAADVDWRRILNLIERQCAKTKDIWLAVYLCRAGARSGNLDTVVIGAEFLKGLCELFWDSAHPQLEDYGFQGRKTPCESLARKGEFLGPMRRVPLVVHPRLGSYSGDDLDRFRTGGDKIDGYIIFRKAIEETPDEVFKEAARKLAAIGAAVRQVDAILMANSDGDTGANFATTYETLNELRTAVLAFAKTPLEEEVVETELEPDAAAGAEGAAAPAPRQKLAGQIEDRDDVIRALDAIADYYRRREPTSPVPMALQRAREWVNVDFLELLRDIAPDALNEAKKLLFPRKDGA